ncbi:MAG TPA: winged helix-turn-helix domain-containing protein [Chryseolinea sp.]|nr:winged helix-turn-helix domain-containing protein [Chryseolinea sp.]
MVVNFVFKGLTNRPVCSGMAIVMIAVFLTASSFTKHSNPDLRVKQVNLIIRQIGHRLLLDAGDSTSRVLPVTEIREGTFLLKFENEFAFKHDSLMMLSRVLLPKTQFPSGYTVTVHDCSKTDIVYGFQLNNTSPDILACRGRSEPQGCYTIEFTFPDFYPKVEQKKTDIDQPTAEPKSSKFGPNETNPIPTAIATEEFKTITSDRDIAKLTEELKSFKVGPQDTNPIPTAIGIEESKTTNSDFPLVNLVYTGMLVLLGVTFLIGRFGKILRRQNQDNAAMQESAQESAALGKLLFNVKDQRLTLGSEVISLTDKECKILELLNKSFGELIPRETLMQEIWINEGVITGRSLDMFVSKLRKKLSSDPELRITNVHGKGYKLEIPGL